MSIQSVRRLKERGGSGGKISALSMPIKPLTPISEKPSLISSGRKSIGKENPGSNPTGKSVSRVSGPTQKPVIRPMPRMSGAETRSKSQPRGRSSSPCDFTRVLSDMRKTRVCNGDSLGKSEVSNGKSLSGFRGLEKKSFREMEKKVGERGGFGLRSGNDLKENGVNEVDLKSNCKKEGNLFVNVPKSISSGGKLSGDWCVDHSNKNGSFAVVDVKLRQGEKFVQDALLNGGCDSSSDKVSSVKSTSHMKINDKGGKFSDGDDSRAKKGCNLEQNSVTKGGLGSNRKSSLELSGKGLSVKISSNSRVLDASKEKGVTEEGGSGRVGSKSASRLQEKLAFLEGKVKRIASDIKKTKEMLDMNNTDASKAILCDIQEKISGIEKAVGNVMADSSTHVTIDCSSVSGHSKFDEAGSLCRSMRIENRNELADSGNASVKGLNAQELEARLLPHEKLLRNRTFLKVSAPISQINGSNVSESSSGKSYPGETSFSPIEDNPIAQQFLASLNKVGSEDISITHADVAVFADEVQETEEPQSSRAAQSSIMLSANQSDELNLQADEMLDEFDDQEIKPALVVDEETEDDSDHQLIEIGCKTATGGWFVSEGESALLTHDDGSCSFHDITNNEEKSEYSPPIGMSQNIWRDCWLIRAPGADGCSGKYVVAASAGNTMDSGFCSWDFYAKDVRAFHIEDNTNNARVALSPLPDNVMYRRNNLSCLMSSENKQWWYRPSGPLIVSTASCQRAVKVYDIRDGERIMKWDVQKPVVAMDYSSPLQWRNRGKVVIAESEAISVWDVSSLSPQALSTVSTSGRRISALHVNNTDAELGGGVRQRVSSTEAEGNDGVFCTAEAINILDFRQPSGIGLKIPKIGLSVQSVSARGDSVLLGCSNIISAAKKQVTSQVLQFSLRKQKVVNTYNLPESSAHSHHKSLTQVWGNSNLIMAVCGLGLFVFDTLSDDGLPSYASNYNIPQNAKEIVGPDDLYSPSFDYHSSQILLISRDRPAMWRHLC